MFKSVAGVTIFLLFFVSQAQEISLPADLRQHTLTQYNASLFNPAFSVDRNNPQSVSLWTRWQWQNIDADPTTLFLNYSRNLGESATASIGFFQHNTGIYFNTGGALNYAYQIEFNRLIKLSVGANVFGFKQQLADTRFPVTPIPGIQQSIPTENFILQVAPGFNLQVENFSLSLASENLFDYNFTDNAANTANSDKIFMGMASYDFPVMASDSTAFIRPSIYLRTIPEQENQIGINALFSTKKFWIQSGYNNFYGISVGAGGTFFNRFSLGALVEFGTSGSLNSKDPSFEIIASYYLGKSKQRRPLVASGVVDEVKQEIIMGGELTIEQMREELDKAERLSNQKEEAKETKTTNEPEVVDDEDTESNSAQEKIKEAKKEARRVAAQQKALEKQQRKDAIAEVNKEKETLAELKKQEDAKAKTAAEAAEKATKSTKAAKIEEIKEERLQKALDKNEGADVTIEAQRAEQQRKLDSIYDAKRAVAAASELKLKEEEKREEELKKKQKADAKAIEEAKASAELITKQLEPEVVKPRAGEKYEEVANSDGLEPGYYLIANVFGTKKYFDAFIRELRSKGIEPKSFFRSLNKYNYAYLERYDSMSGARQARDSKFNGRYSGKTWIFRVLDK